MHTIRLRHPWASEPLPDGRLVYSRKFHRPTGLDGEQVTLALQCIAPWSCSTIRLNGDALPDAAGESLQIDVTGQLQSFNELECEFASSDALFPSEAPLFEQLASAELQIHGE